MFFIILQILQSIPFSFEVTNAIQINYYISFVCYFVWFVDIDINRGNDAKYIVISLVVE